MIFYFSATGNSKWTALKLAESLNDKAYDITKINAKPEQGDMAKIGYVFPIHAWGVPRVMKGFIDRFKFSAPYTYAVATCGEDAGKAIHKLMKEHHFNSGYSIAMPNNYIIGSDIDSDADIIRKITKAQEEIQKIAEEINDEKTVYRVNEGRMAAIKSSIINRGFIKFAANTKPFSVLEDRCDSCGLCASNCPLSTIRLVNGRPVWGKDCCQCLACINNCPHEAIQYGGDTRGKGRYNIEKYINMVNKKGCNADFMGEKHGCN